MSAQPTTQTSLEQASEKPLPTLWRVPEALWQVMQALILAQDPPKPTGRRRIDARKAFDGILFRMRTGCQWNHLPKHFGDDSSVHRTFQRWQELGLFADLFTFVVARCDELGGVDWQWQAADCCLGRTFGTPKKRRSKKKSVPIPPTEHDREPRTACSSKPRAVRSR